MVTYVSRFYSFLYGCAADAAGLAQAVSWHLDEKDVLYLCEHQAGISSVPIRVFRERELLASWGLDGMPVDPARPQLPTLLTTDRPVMYLATPWGQYVGAVRAGDLRVVAGPIGSLSLTRQQQLDFAFQLGLGEKAFLRMYDRMSVVPPLPLLSFLHMLLLMSFMYTGQRLELEDVSPYLQMAAGNGSTGAAVPLGAPEGAASPGSDASRRNDRLVHNALGFERQMLGYVRSGDVTGLRGFLGHRNHGSEGVIGPDHLRDEKNMLVVVATLASRAAVEGGLPEDEAMRLSDAYIMRSEGLFSADAVVELQAHMVADFTRRVSQVGLAGLDPLAARAITYVRRNISSKLTGEEVARVLHVSRQTLCARFAASMGAPLGEYVAGEKVRRAKQLLEQTDRSIADIADYLGYSSQSHFQTRFKAATGMTPGEWRRQARGQQGGRR